MILSRGMEINVGVHSNLALGRYSGTVARPRLRRRERTQLEVLSLEPVALIIDAIISGKAGRIECSSGNFYDVGR